jgi:hypothetical protein
MGSRRSIQGVLGLQLSRQRLDDWEPTAAR